MSAAKRHPLVGRPVKVTKGPYKDRYVVVVDFLQNQFQGKDVKNIDKGHPNLTREIKKRGLLDDKAVFVRLYPSMEHIVVHDTEIQLVKEEAPKKLKAIKGGKDDTTGSSDGDNQTTEPGGHESDGRSVSGDEELTEVPSPFRKEDESDRTAGSGDGGTEEESEGHDKPKARSSKSAKNGKAKSKR